MTSEAKRNDSSDSDVYFLVYVCIPPPPPFLLISFSNLYESPRRYRFL